MIAIRIRIIAKWSDRQLYYCFVLRYIIVPWHVGSMPDHTPSHIHTLELSPTTLNPILQMYVTVKPALLPKN